MISKPTVNGPKFSLLSLLEENEITVVAIWSDKLATLASHMKNYNPNTFPIKKGKTKNG